ncbi:hypothetical protein evm_003917 [Chilo suppressalis]|nr:hypothetical protein evm_003917 [Chilo suppressalis]
MAWPMEMERSMKCRWRDEAKIAERNERAKKLYRYVTDVARRIGESTTKCSSITDLFCIHLELQRQKLRDSCEKLLFLDPINSGKKALELLWRKVYYEPVGFYKKLRESDTENDSLDLYSHIISGIGHFQYLLARIQVEMNVKYNELDYTILKEDEETEEVEHSINSEELQISRSVTHLCLIYLGDLCRYQVEIFQFNDQSISARYYLQAAQMELSSGMPYNQLGNLYLDKNYNLDSVCYYIHCLSCESPFSGAMGNLTKIFEKNNQCYEMFQNVDNSSQTEHIQNIVANFLSLIEIWYFSKNDTNISQRCSVIVHQLKVAMDFPKPPLPDLNKNYTESMQVIEEENVSPTYLNANLVNKIVLICLFTMAKMTESDETKAFACKAFTLALLSQLLQKFLKELEAMGLRNPATKYKPKVAPAIDANVDVEKLKFSEEHAPALETENKNEGTTTADNTQVKQVKADEDIDKIQNGDNKNSKKISKRRRRRRIVSSGSSDLSNVESGSSEADTDDSSSVEDNVSESTYQSEDSNSEVSDLDGSDVEEIIEKQNGDIAKSEEECVNKYKKTNGASLTENVVNDNKAKNPNLDENEIQNFLLGNNLLCSIKLLQDWILTEKELILSCGDSGEALFQSVVDLLNILTHYFNTKSKESSEIKECKILDYSKHIVRNLKLEYKSIPLPEDVNLRGTNICKFDKNATEWQILDRFKPSVYEENILRILNFIEFGNQIAKIVPRIRFNRSMKIFYVKKTQSPKINTKVVHKRNREWHNSKKQHEESEGGLLRRLGKLWLTSQVRELERSGRAAVPALLAIDTAALNQHLRRVKQLLRARNFILLVPTVVLQELDELKREQSTARDAIRWLETQLRSGSRFLRAQRPGQSRPLPLLKYPRKAPTYVHNFIQILEFCNHFIGEERQSQGGNGDSENAPGKSAPLLILLVGNELGSTEEQYKEFSLTGAAETAGISIQYIGDFYTKWRHAVHKNGKKR